MTVAALFLLLIYSILEELSLHGLFHRSDRSWLFRSCFKSSYLATLSVTGDGQSCASESYLAKWWSGRLAFSGPLPSLCTLLPYHPQELLNRFDGRETLARRGLSHPNQMLTFYCDLQWRTEMTSGKNTTGLDWKDFLTFFKPNRTDNSVVHHDKL